MTLFLFSWLHSAVNDIREQYHLKLAVSVIRRQTIVATLILGLPQSYSLGYFGQVNRQTFEVRNKGACTTYKVRTFTSTFPQVVDDSHFLSQTLVLFLKTSLLAPFSPITDSHLNPSFSFSSYLSLTLSFTRVKYFHFYLKSFARQLLSSRVSLRWPPLIRALRSWGGEWSLELRQSSLQLSLYYLY